ncbi:MAG: DUF523 domain-containing protein [Vicinamibacterales bacterium]
MERVLVSACLLGHAVRYDGRDKKADDGTLARWVAEGRVVAVCPEVAGGLAVPRPPAEVEAGAGGDAVLAASARVIAVNGDDVTTAFVHGATHALQRARDEHIRVAVLKEGSPSCGSSYSYDGTFSGTRVDRPGVTTALLRRQGVRVFSEHEWAEADALLRALDGADAEAAPGEPR